MRSPILQTPFTKLIVRFLLGATLRAYDDCFAYKSLRSYPACGLHGHLVLLGEASEHFGLEGSGEGDEGQEAEDDHGELPAEVEGDYEGHADVCQRVDDHADLGACGLEQEEMVDWYNNYLFVAVLYMCIHL